MIAAPVAGDCWERPSQSPPDNDAHRRHGPGSRRARQSQAASPAALAGRRRTTSWSAGGELHRAGALNARRAWMRSSTGSAAPACGWEKLRRLGLLRRTPARPRRPLCRSRRGPLDEDVRDGASHLFCSQRRIEQRVRAKGDDRRRRWCLLSRRPRCRRPGVPRPVAPVSSPGRRPVNPFASCTRCCARFTGLRRPGQMPRSPRSSQRKTARLTSHLLVTSPPRDHVSQSTGQCRYPRDIDAAVHAVPIEGHVPRPPSLGRPARRAGRRWDGLAVHEL